MSAPARARRRGQPLAVLVMLLAGWVGMRALLWESPFPAAAGEAARAVQTARLARGGERRDEAYPPAAAPARGAVVGSERRAPRETLSRSPAPAWPAPYPVTAPAPRSPLGTASRPLPLTPTAPSAGRGRVIAGHQLMMLAGLSRLPLLPLLGGQAPPAGAGADAAALAPTRADPAAAPALVRVARSQWSGDGWVLIRRGAGGFAAAPGLGAAGASYGASQAGAVLRYALAPRSSLAPQGYLRLSRALGGIGEGEAAAGVALRPLAALPVRVLAEGRVQRSLGSTRVRPAASLVSALAPQDLPLGVRAELYGQAGYVGGKGATPFFDAQLAADRAILGQGAAELRVGAGAWAGGQRGAARLDLGPRASLRLRLGEAPSRLALDWRFRVAGNAAPGSGPAVTFSAGF